MSVGIKALSLIHKFNFFAIILFQSVFASSGNNKSAFSKCFWGAGYIKLEAVWLLKATFWVPVGREHLGESWKFLKLRCSMVWFDAIWGTWRVRIVSHFYQLDLLSFSITCPKIPFIHKLFQVCQDKIAKHLRFSSFLINLIVNNYRNNPISCSGIVVNTSFNITVEMVKFPEEAAHLAGCRLILRRLINSVGITITTSFLKSYLNQNLYWMIVTDLNNSKRICKDLYHHSINCYLQMLQNVKILIFLSDLFFFFLHCSICYYIKLLCKYFLCRLSL